MDFSDYPAIKQKNTRQKENYKIILIVMLLSIMTILTYYFQAMLNVEIIFTHLFYTPIILSALWWERKGMAVAVFLALMLLTIHIIYGSGVSLIGDTLRASMFLVVGAITTVLSEQITNMKKELIDASKNLEEILDARTVNLRMKSEELQKEIIIRKNTEKIMLKEKKFVNTLVQTSPLFYVAMDADGRVILMNDSMLKAIGHTLDEVTGVDYLLTFVPEEEREMLSKTFEKIVKHHEQTINENHLLTKDGRKFLIEWHGRSVLNENGTIDFFFGVGVDITERKKAGEALMEREKSYRTLAENIPGIVYRVLLKENNRMLFFNNMIESMTGYKEEDLKVGDVCSIDPLIFKEDRERVIDIVEKAIQNKEPFVVDYQVEKRDGTSRFFIERGRPVFDENGEPEFIEGVIFDITARKKSEEAIKDLTETIGTINKILRHDILNDLTLLLNIVDSCKDGDEKMKKSIFATINKSVSLIERMRELELAVTSGEDLKQCTVLEIVGSVIRNYPEIEFKVKGNCIVFADEALSSVIDNIVRNAIVHGKTKRIDIAMTESKEYCKIRIADYGIGVPDKIKKKIFEEGFSYGEIRSSGLGLYIVKKVIERYGGTIEVEDNKPNGTVFILKLKRGE